MSLRDIHRSNGAVGLKLIALVIVALVVVAGLGAIALMGSHSSLSENDNNSQSEVQDVQYTGAIVPNSVISGNDQSSGYTFTGHPSDEPSSALQTFGLQSAQSFSGITGGNFTITNSDSDRVLKSVDSDTTKSLQSGSVPAEVSQTYDNINVNITAVSIVYAGYTFGIGTTGTDDYIWIAPHHSYPTFFNQVSVNGMVMDQATLDNLSAGFTSSVFASIDLKQVSDVASKFGFSFNGTSDHFLVINQLTYINTTDVKGDVIDTLTPSDLDRLASLYTNSGTDWIKDVVKNIGEGAAFVAESNSTPNLTRMWILLYPLQMNSSFDGICNIDVSQSSYSILHCKVNQDASSFTPLGEGHEFIVDVGIPEHIIHRTIVHR